MSRRLAMLVLASILVFGFFPAQAHGFSLDAVTGAEIHGAAAGDLLGFSVAVWGDTMVVGVREKDIDANTNAGEALVYVHEGRDWVLKQVLRATTPRSNARFGSSVAIAGGIIVVGATTEGTSNVGAAYVYRWNGSSWVSETDLHPVDYGVWSFGWSVDTDDGTVVVGAPYSNGFRGAAFVYKKSAAGTWTSQRIDDPTPADGDCFGMAVAIWGTQLAISSPAELTGGVRAGAVHLYYWSPGLGKYAYQETLVPRNPEAEQLFGYALDMERYDLIVGSPGETYGGAAGHGLAYRCCKREDFLPQWVLVTTLAPAATLGANAGFGSSVAVSGATIAVGAPRYDTNHGLVQVFDSRVTPTYPDRTLYESSTLSGPAWVTSESQLGFGVGLSGGTVACGAPGCDSPTTDCGAVVAYRFVYPLAPDYWATRVWGADRYLTCVEASKRGFPYGAPAVVVCTGENWPDALGGAGLAGAAHGPVLLTPKAALPDSAASEIQRLGAVKAYVLGGTGAVSTAVENQLVGLLGRSNVVRLAGADRYATASAVAAETIKLRGSGYLGIAVVATGAKFPDAVAAAPLLAWNGTPLVLANPTSTHVVLPPEVAYAVVAGGTSVVSEAQFNDLVAQLGAGNVVRKSGADRYATAAALAQSAVDTGMSANGVGLATGENFPDALSAGPMLGTFGSPLLLTRSATLSPPADTKLRAWRPGVQHLHVIGGTSVVSSGVVTAAQNAAWGP
ncbi:MAG: cell wall-binding repeat-containing protein [Anaerosomatales bacterium]|nr:cell wall-binding repeat-containing protein [Anaerosomatales bacterium]